MAGTYELWLTTDTGSRIALLDNILDATFARITSGIGVLNMSLPGSFDTSLLARDRMIQVWRAPLGGTLSLFRVYFLRWWRFARRGSDLTIQVKGKDANELLFRRYVINFAGTAGAGKTDFTDDMMKAYVDEQSVTDGSAPSPDFGARAITGLTIQADASDGPVISRAAAWRNLADLQMDLSKASRAEGTEIFWDVKETVGTGTISFQFRTKTGQPGADLTDSIVFDEARGNLEESSLTEDYTQEVNYVYGLGQGQGENRVVEQVWDADRINASAYNRREGVAFASNAESPSAVENAANERLTNGLSRRMFSGRAIDTEGTRFGRDWNWGDRVTARFLNFEFEAIIRKLVIKLSGRGLETIDARIESEQIIS